eukprot:TRINITY_DN426_c0_g1_i1.p1 TRINITY_DN426_c0_g1~~TRINITY_DN426_c0_g1_i1.p1  ORF type:complete len:1254 (-),score=327.70 TRINITY_DN426_c0_g1_i1:86-3814(-)
MQIVLIVCLLIGAIFAQCPSGGTQLGSTNMDVTIAAGQTYYISGDLALNSISVSGTLYFKNAPSNLSLKWLRVNKGGKLYIGQRTCPITSKITVTLNGARDDVSNDMGNDPFDGVALGSKGIAIATGGFIEIWGEYKKTPFTNIKQYVNKGDTTIYVAAGTSWAVGDTIVLVETDYPAVPYTYTSAFDQNEVVNITAITANIKCPNSNDKCDQITINNALKYVHYCNVNEYCGEVAHLTRNIIIRGDSSSAQSLFGGHIMIRSVTGAALVGAEFTAMGQRGVVGRYPIHFHQMGQTDGVSVFAKYNSIHDNFQRCLVIHDSNNITVDSNVAYNITCSCYFLEDGSEINNVFTNNLGAKVLNIQDGDREIIPSDTQASVFWIPNPLNFFTGNVASGGTFGFWYVFPVKPNGKSEAKYANDNMMSPRKMPLGSFSNNVAHSNRDSGVMVDEFQNPDGTIQQVANPSWSPQTGPYNSTTAGKAVPGTFSDVLAYKNRQFGLWFRASNLWFYRIKSFDNRVGFQAIVQPATVQNSLFICETNNTGYFINPGWAGFVVTPRARANIWSPYAPVYGYQNYDAAGPQFQNNNTFGSCFSNQFRQSSIISSLENAHNILFPQNRYLRTKVLDGSQRFFNQRYPNNYSAGLEQDSPKFVHIHDVDGTITGNMGTWSVPEEPFHTYNLSVCVANKTEASQRCGPFYEGFGYLNIKNMNTGNTEFSGTNLNNTNPWIRSNFYYFGDTQKANGIGTTGESWQDATRTEYRLNMIARRGLVVTWPHPSPPSLDLMFTAAAPGDWVVVGIPYPAGTIKVFRGTYPAANFTQVSSLDNLVADTYYFGNNMLYVRVENSLPASSTTSKFDGGFVYQASWNNQVSIRHSCTKSGCAPGTVTIPPALPAYESLYKADLCPATGTSNTYGQAFLGFDMRTKILSYQIYHGKGPQTVSLTMGGFDLGIPYSPAEGVFYPSYTQYQNIYSGKWQIAVNELVGMAGCETSRNKNCVPPPQISVQAACSVPQDNFVIISSNALNQITANKPASWTSWSWGTTISNSTDKPTSCSTGSLSINTMTGGFAVHNDANGILVAKTSFLQFWAKAVTPSQIKLQLAITTSNSSVVSSLVVTSKYINNWAITNEGWTRVRIPLADFGYNTDTFVARIDMTYYQSWTLTANQTLLITDYRFVSSSVADPQGYPTSVTQSNYASKSCYVDPGLLVRDATFTTTTTSSTTTSTSSASSFFVSSALLALSFLLFF